jgi:hypothetical protein
LGFTDRSNHHHVVGVRGLARAEVSAAEMRPVLELTGRVQPPDEVDCASGQVMGMHGGDGWRNAGWVPGYRMRVCSHSVIGMLGVGMIKS